VTQLLRKLWRDDAGVVALEYLLVAWVLGSAAVEESMNSELTKLANGTLPLSQGYGINTQSRCVARKRGSQALDTPQVITSYSARGRSPPPPRCRRSSTSFPARDCRGPGAPAVPNGCSGVAVARRAL
jgi:hypothetical protein